MEVREEKSRGTGYVILGVGLILLLVLYVFSIGPAWWLARQVPTTDRYVRVIYIPLGFAGDLIPPFGRFIEWYMHLWV